MYATLAAHADRITNANRDSARDAGIAVWQETVQDGRCWDCGKTDTSEFLHVIGSGARAVAVGGSLVSAGALGCRECNDVHRALCKALGTPGVLPESYVTSPDRHMSPIMALPSRAELVRMARPVLDARKSRQDERVAAALAAL